MARQANPVAAFKVGDFVSFAITAPGDTHKNKRRGNITRIKGRLALVNCSGDLIPVFISELKHHVSRAGASNAAK